MGMGGRDIVWNCRLDLQLVIWENDELYEMSVAFGGYFKRLTENGQVQGELIDLWEAR